MILAASFQVIAGQSSAVRRLWIAGRHWWIVLRCSCLPSRYVFWIILPLLADLYSLKKSINSYPTCAAFQWHRVKLNISVNIWPITTIEDATMFSILLSFILVYLFYRHHVVIMSNSMPKIAKLGPYLKLNYLNEYLTNHHIWRYYNVFHLLIFHSSIFNITITMQGGRPFIILRQLI